MPRKRAPTRNEQAGQTNLSAGTLRIIGGRLRGRPIQYLGDPRTRPMKQRVREAAFNLVGSRVAGTHVIDLFAGTGALAWEALSRGAASATLIERHFPTARLIRENAAALGVSELVEVVPGDTFVWARKLTREALLPRCDSSWVVFCSPPYELYVTEPDRMGTLIRRMIELAPPGSLIVVESDQRFDLATLPTRCTWDAREYPPAVLAVAEIPSPPRD